MIWTLPADLRAPLLRLWERGDLLRAAVAPAACGSDGGGDPVGWPLRLGLKTPGAADLSDRFDTVRDWVQQWVQAEASSTHWRIEWRERHDRVQGQQRLPHAVWVDTLAQALALIGQTRQSRVFVALWRQTQSVQPALCAWMLQRPQQALALAERWERLLGVVAWLQARPRPGVYLRQVDVPGVDSKFIESHRGVLAELLERALPPEAIEPAASGVGQFARRFGFLDKPQRIRFRLLDAALPSLPGCQGLRDISVDAPGFAQLSLPVKRVFITENETNFLAFPPVAQAIVVFGAGYGWDALRPATWLHRCELHYWGDIDTHGFAILDQLRAQLPDVASFLMDRQTLLAHRLLWGQEPEPVRHGLTRLTADEAALYDELRCDQYQAALRLEQERVGFGWLQGRLHGMA